MVPAWSSPLGELGAFEQGLIPLPGLWDCGQHMVGRQGNLWATFIFGFGATPRGTQGLFLALSAGVTPGSALGNLMRCWGF